MSKIKITFLGTGTSHGVPSIDCMLNNFERCKKDVCRLSLTDSKHNRTRSSILVEHNDKHILIDVSADFRQQALRERIPKIDAVLITHCHADHISGIPDIRSYNGPAPHVLDFYGSHESMESIQESFHYIFSPKTFVGGGIPRLALHQVDKPFILFDAPITPLPVVHGSLKGCLGYRIKNLAYIPDVKTIPEETKSNLENLDCLILDCLRDAREHSTHMILEESLQFARDVAPARCYFIHMSHDIHYALDAEKLDHWMEFSYDGMKIEVMGEEGDR
jgi:phosphoribosyl 1,2-cyclic phosphate phosphodiesterase